MASSERELLPCPFCGGEAKMQDDYGHYPCVVHPMCPDCGAAMFDDNGYPFESADEAVKAWNRRTAATDAQFAAAVRDGGVWRRDPCDRDALLALADGLGELGWCVPQAFRDWGEDVARRIREACGEVEE